MDCFLLRLVTAARLVRFGLLMQMSVASRGLVAVRFGILRGCFGILERAFAGCIFGMADKLLVDVPKSGNNKRTLTSSHDCIFLTPSPMSLNVSFDSSKRSCTLSRTLSVSRLVPSNAISLVSLDMFPVREKSFVMSSCDKRWNSGSSEYCGSSCRRMVVGWDSNDDN
jgi:hypothetical protein